ncbi:MULTISPECIES: hypothetical protein [unclassified Phenylobacterium]|jgi:hypothetical protein|uniref:hypothetical protein n=1 Tax=unclassified Phenylobacterium TaxID=2640670 RepID=UPI000839ED17|nr:MULTISPECIES: hypothetical protein [unclassified Phenylobacterium]
MSDEMRLLLAFLAVLGLLMTPVAASAGAAACLHHKPGGAAMSMDAPQAAHPVHAADHSCCDEDGAPAKHDSQACAKACAAMCVTAAALTDVPIQAPAPVGRPHVEAAPLKAFHAHAPPGLKRPPRG